jgi:hypothetical protein
MKPQDSRENLQEENFYSALKLQKYGGGLNLKISDFVSFLAWTGTMAGVLGILASLELFILLSETFSYHLSGNQQTVVFYVLGAVSLFTSTVWLALHLALRKRNVNKDFEGIKNILKIKCYITGTFEIICSTMGLMAATLVAIATSGYQTPMDYINIIEGVICFLYLVFASCKIHGVRKDNNRCINSYIVFKLIIFVVLVALGISLLVALLPHIGSPGTACILFIFGLILFSFGVIYYMGAVVVLLNFNHHFNSETNYKNLAFTNQAFWEENTKSQA